MDRKQTELPIGKDHIKTINYVLEAVSLFLGHNEIEIDIARNKLIQIPDLSEAILQCVTFTEFDEKIRKKLQMNEIDQMSYEFIVSQKLRLVKFALWKFIIIMWYFECLYMTKNSGQGQMSDQMSNWAIRLEGVSAALKMKNNAPPNLKGNEQLEEIYLNQ